MRGRKSGHSYLEPNKGRMLKTDFFQKVKRIAKSYNPKSLPTEELRGSLILDLKVLVEIAHDRAVAIEKGGRATTEHQKCARLAAYISKCINVIMREYDSVKIKRKLDELTELVRSELQERDKESRKA